MDSIAIQSSLKNLSEAYDRFFKKQNKQPRFKSKKNPIQSYTTKFTNNNIRIESDKILLPKLKWIKFAKSREVTGRIINVTVRRSPSNKYYISILAEENIEHLPKTNSNIGIDVGLKELAVLSNGVIYSNPRHLYKLQNKLAKEQRILSRRRELAMKKKIKLDEAKNYQKQRIKVAKLYEKITNARLDYLHKVSTEIIKSHDIIGIEDLQVSNMLNNKRMSKAISDVSWSRFRTLLESKADWYGKQVIAVGKTFPSSQLCSNCGYRNKDVKNLALREWDCVECNSHQDRDINASINIRNEALRILSA